MADPFVSPSMRMTQHFRMNKIPDTAVLELTPRCTLDCKMCYVHLTPEQMGDRKEMDTKQWLHFIDEAVDAGLLIAALTGGECMLHPGFWEIFRYLREKGVAVSVNTNAFVLTDADIERFLEIVPASIRITLYGASAEDYARLTGHGEAFARVVENIKKLKAAGLRVKLSTTVTKYNYKSYIDILSLAWGLGIPAASTWDLFLPNEDTERTVSDITLTPEQIVELCLAYRKKIGREPFQNPPLELPGRLEGVPEIKGMRCGSGRDSYCVHWDGSLGACLNFRGPRVQDVGFAAAWEAAKQAAAEYPQPVECAVCKLASICTGCVFLRHDPKDPNHVNPEYCKIMLGRYNAGIDRLRGPNDAPDPAELALRSLIPDGC